MLIEFILSPKLNHAFAVHHRPSKPWQASVAARLAAAAAAVPGCADALSPMRSVLKLLQVVAKAC